jgi:hypothetical protein
MSAHPIFLTHQNRLAAITAGSKTFDAGMPCIHGHSGPGSRYCNPPFGCCACAADKYQKKRAALPPKPPRPDVVLGPPKRRMHRRIEGEAQRRRGEIDAQRMRKELGTARKHRFAFGPALTSNEFMERSRRLDQRLLDAQAEMLAAIKTRLKA